MTEFSCSVKVVSVQGNTAGYGATAELEFVQPSVGIDFTPGGGSMIAWITEDAEGIVKEGAYLRLTISDKDPIPPGPLPQA